MHFSQVLMLPPGKTHKKIQGYILEGGRELILQLLFIKGIVIGPTHYRRLKHECVRVGHGNVGEY